MPHSVSSPAGSPGRGDDDEVLPDAPAVTENGAAAGVKLEDLFNDDENEEFPASSAADTKMDSPESAE